MKRMRNAWLAAGAVLGYLLITVGVHARTKSLPVGHAGEPKPKAPALSKAQNLREGYGDAPGSHGLHIPLIVWMLMFSVVLVLGAVVLAMVAVLFTKQLPSLQRFRRRPSVVIRPIEYALPDAEQLGERVGASFEAALAGIRRGEAAEAIIACWAQLEQVAHQTGLIHRPSDTAGELADRLLTSLRLNRADLAELAALYREARFSSHPITAAASERAVQSLQRLRSELAGAVAAPLAGVAGG